jgi:predicted HTH transcriptional regulator
MLETQNIGTSDPENENMRIFKDLELVETLGFGIRGITQVYSQDIFKFSDNTMYVQLPFDESVVIGRVESGGIIEESKGMIEKSKGIILELIIENPKISVPEIARTINLSLSGVEKNIRQLKKDGKLSRTTNTKKGEWIVIG